MSTSDSEKLKFLKNKLAEVDGTEAHVLEISKTALALTERNAIAQFARDWVSNLKALTDKALEYVYVANDVIQRSQMKNTPKGMSEEFAVVLPDALRSIPPENDDWPKIMRVLGIWRERNVYGEMFIRELKKVVYDQRQHSIGFLVSDDEDGPQEEYDNSKREMDEENDFDGDVKYEFSSVKKRQHKIAIPYLLSNAREKEANVREKFAALTDDIDAITAQLCGKQASDVMDDIDIDLKSFKDDQIKEILENLLDKLKKSRIVVGEFEECTALENSLLTSLEQGMEQASLRLENHESRTTLCKDLEGRVIKLKDAHPELDVLDMVRTVKKGIVRTDKTKHIDADNERLDQDQAGVDGSPFRDEEEDDEDDDEYNEEDYQEDERSKSAKSAIFRQPKRRKKKKLKNEEADISDTPMMYNKVLKRYVPVPIGGSEESWRDH